MSERRSKKRLPTEPIEVNSATLRGQVLNLSMDGLAIETATPLHPGKPVSFRLDGEGSTLSGSVRWAKLKSVRPGDDGDSESIYHAGIALRGQSEAPDDPEDPDDD